jgi:hypothetical protein
MEVEAAAPALPRRHHPRAHNATEPPVQFSLAMEGTAGSAGVPPAPNVGADLLVGPEPGGSPAPTRSTRRRGSKPENRSHSGLPASEHSQEGTPEPEPIVHPPAPEPLPDSPDPAELETVPPEPEPPDFDPDPFADIPGLGPTPPASGEFVLLPASLRGRLDLREFTRFLADLPTVVRDWEGAPEVDEGGIRLRGAEGGAWLYPETRRVRLVTDGATEGRLGEDLVALCRWLESRAGMRLYPEGAGAAVGPDRSLDPWETFLGV